MTSETENLKLKLQSLSSAFVDLEDQLALLFAQSLPETLVDLEPIQAAKLQTVLAYVVYDLIFSTYYSE
jgi:exosome complex protein LRP1